MLSACPGWESRTWDRIPDFCSVWHSPSAPSTDIPWFISAQCDTHHQPLPLRAAGQGCAGDSPPSGYWWQWCQTPATLPLQPRSSWSPAGTNLNPWNKGAEFPVSQDSHCSPFPSQKGGWVEAELRCFGVISLFWDYFSFLGLFLFFGVISLLQLTLSSWCNSQKLLARQRFAELLFAYANLVIGQTMLLISLSTPNFLTFMLTCSVGASQLEHWCAYINICNWIFLICSSEVTDWGNNPLHSHRSHYCGSQSFCNSLSGILFLKGIAGLV